MKKTIAYTLSCQCGCKTLTLTYLDIVGFRNLISAQVAPASRLNLIYGHNGSGKTSLLEAIYYLSLGRSFRSALASRIIHHGADKLSIFAHLLTNTDQTLPLGLERRTNSELKLRLQGNDMSSIVEFADRLPVQLIDSHCHNLLEGAPTFRRKYLDWAGFYLNNDFMRSWKQFVRALKQRNAALRQGGAFSCGELVIWDQELAVAAMRIDQLRQQVIELLVPTIGTFAAELLAVSGLKISYESGLGPRNDYLDALKQNLPKDLQLGHTQIGPHKADLRITINNIPAKDILSRGQQKLFVCAMILARGALLQRCVNKQPIYLVDDLPAELDAKSRSSLIALLSKQDTQLFMTATENKSWNDFLMTMGPSKMFHVEHGKVSDEGGGPL